MISQPLPVPVIEYGICEVRVALFRLLRLCGRGEVSPQTVVAISPAPSIFLGCAWCRKTPAHCVSGSTYTLGNNRVGGKENIPLRCNVQFPARNVLRVDRLRVHRK